MFSRVYSTSTLLVCPATGLTTTILAYDFSVYADATWFSLDTGDWDAGGTMGYTTRSITTDSYSFDLSELCDMNAGIVCIKLVLRMIKLNRSGIRPSEISI